MKSNYGRDIFKQLQECIERIEAMETNHKNEIQKIKISYEKRIDEIIAENRIEKEELNIQIKKLEIENAELKKANLKMQNEIERLKSVINNDSTNSSKPPSSDQKGKKANKYNTREKSDKKPGGQKGHKGTTLSKEEIEQKIKSGEYKHKIINIGEPKGNYEKKYIIDLEIVTTVTELRYYENENGEILIPEEHHSDVVYGANTKAMTALLFSEGVMSNNRICSFLNAMSDGKINISEGSIYNFCKKFAERASESILHIEIELLNEHVLNTDATNVSTNGKQTYIRNFSANDAVLYYALEKKNKESLEEINIINNYSGTFMHDHEVVMYNYGVAHAECNIHLIRYLLKNTQESKNQWSQELINLLIKMNDDRKVRISSGASSFSNEEVASYEKRYDDIVIKGLEEHKNTKIKYIQQDEQALLNRLQKYKENHLLFLKDFRVEFTNNMSERDLRKCKNRQKMSGGFRKQSGVELYCDVMSIVETCKRKGMNILNSLKSIFESPLPIF